MVPVTLRSKVPPAVIRSAFDCAPFKSRLAPLAIVVSPVAFPSAVELLAFNVPPLTVTALAKSFAVLTVSLLVPDFSMPPLPEILPAQ